LWRGFVQITRTTPQRRTTLHRSQMRLTELRTFIAISSGENGEVYRNFRHSVHIKI